MRESRQAFAGVFQELSDGACVSDGRGRIFYLNPAAERLLGLPPDEYVGQSLCELLCDRLAREGSGNPCPFRHEARRGVATLEGLFQAWRGPERRRRSQPFSPERRKAQARHVRVRCLPMPTALFESWEPETRLTLIEDVTSQAELERLREDWRDMVAHDLRVPLTSILVGLSALKDVPEGQRWSSAQARIADTSLQAGRRMLELLNLYLDLANLDAGSMPVAPAAVHPGAVAERCLRDLEPLAASRGIRVSVSIPVGLAVRADAALLERTLENLLHNALKFTPEGGAVRISGEARQDGTGVIAVEDTGPGIPPEILPYLFDRFQQARLRRAGKFRGSGLGLAFCREAVRAMNGTIEAASPPGKGSSFAILLPLA